MNITELFWNSSLDEMKNGFIEDEIHYTCLLCGRKIEKGIIYPVDEVLYEARKYMEKHIGDEHGSVFEYLSRLDKKLTGLSDHQSRLISLFFQGKSDSEVQNEMQIGSPSTIRNHRFALKEKEKQARVFLVMMELLKEKSKNVVKTISPSKALKEKNDRYTAADEENKKLLGKYFPESLDGKLVTFSMQHKHKLVVLREIARRLDSGRTYTEKELNEILKGIYEYDFVAIRRYLIEYGFMERKSDGSEYWVKKTTREETNPKKSQEKVISGVYQIRNTKNQKIFITSGRNISKLNGPKFELNMGSYRNKLLQDEWNQYGEGAFVFEILESFEEDGDTKGLTKRIKSLEKDWIGRLQSFGERGYNEK